MTEPADALSDVRAALVRPPSDGDGPGLKRSAVAAMLSPDRRLWLIQRAARAGDPWSGHLGFPGGREEDADDDLLATAVRETWEELGVDLAGAELLGRLDDLRARPVRALLVRPFVFQLRDVPRLSPNHEVDAVLTVSLDTLLSGVGRGRMRWPVDSVGPMQLPKVDVEGPVPLWGLTLRMVDDLLHRLDGRGTGLARPAQPGTVRSPRLA